MPAPSRSRRTEDTPAASQALIRAVHRELRQHADPVKAPKIQAYMKSAMPFRGVQVPQQRTICRRLFPRYPLADFESWRDTVLALWRTARFREERHAAIELTGHRLYREYQTMKSLPVYEEMIVTGAWWDYVDNIATHRLRGLLESYPKAITRRMRSWSRSSDLWKRRSAIICQVGRKTETDLELLYACIAENAARPEFFLRKAIGWALRSFAWTNPEEVQRYVEEQGNTLSPLSRREALKNIGG